MTPDGWRFPWWQRGNINVVGRILRRSGWLTEPSCTVESTAENGRNARLEACAVGHLALLGFPPLTFKPAWQL